jgi:hypothetical protein
LHPAEVNRRHPGRVISLPAGQDLSEKAASLDQPPHPFPSRRADSGAGPMG